MSWSLWPSGWPSTCSGARAIHVFPRLAALGLDAPVSAIRAFVAPSRAYLPKFVLYNLPDALWSYALGAWLTGTWRSGAAKAPWLAVGAAVVMAAEGLQGLGILPGTFDPIDLVASIAGYALALVLATPRSLVRLTNIDSLDHHREELKMIDSKRHAVSFAGLLFFAVMAVGSGKPSDNKSSTTQTTSANAGDSLIGLGFSVGGAEWTITEVVDRGSRLKPKFGTTELSTQGRYIQARFKITNKSSKEGFFLARPKIVDDKGREFDHISFVSDYVTPGGTGESMVEARDSRRR